MIFSNRNVVLASALAVGIVAASAGTMLFAKQAKKGERVNIVITTVKAGKQHQFEDYMTKFEAAVEKARKMDATMEKVAAQTRALYPAKANEDGTFTYVFLMDPVLPDPSSYDMIEILKMVLKEDEVNRLEEQLEDAMGGPQQVLELVQK